MYLYYCYLIHCSLSLQLLQAPLRHCLQGADEHSLYQEVQAQGLPSRSKADKKYLQDVGEGGLKAKLSSSFALSQLSGLKWRYAGEPYFYQ